jgi:hypothetical protein
MVAISRTSLASSFGLAAAALAGFAEAELILLIRCAAFVWVLLWGKIGLGEPTNGTFRPSFRYIKDPGYRLFDDGLKGF